MAIAILKGLDISYGKNQVKVLGWLDSISISVIGRVLSRFTPGALAVLHVGI
jgi:hypothetical protein